jgi:hypothetical protein
LNRIEEHEDWVQEISIEPEFVVRDSTGRVPAQPYTARDDQGTLVGAPLAMQPES